MSAAEWNIINLEKSFATLTRADPVVLADSVVTTDGTESILTGRRPSWPGLRQGSLDGRRGLSGSRGGGRVWRRRQGEVAAGCCRVAAGRWYGGSWSGWSGGRLNRANRAHHARVAIPATCTQVCVQLPQDSIKHKRRTEWTLSKFFQPIILVLSN